MERKGIEHLHVILGKIVIILKLYGFQKDLLSTITFKDPRKLGCLGQKYDYIGLFEEKSVY